MFISYRRDDTRHIVGRLYDRMVKAFGKSNVFLDVDSIEVGAEFPAVLHDKIQACEVVVVVIGPTSTWHGSPTRATTSARS